LQRWINPDPIGYSAGDNNLDRFVAGNPLSSTDPSGLLQPFIGLGRLAVASETLPGFVFIIGEATGEFISTTTGFDEWLGGKIAVAIDGPPKSGAITPEEENPQLDPEVLAKLRAAQAKINEAAGEGDFSGDPGSGGDFGGEEDPPAPAPAPAPQPSTGGAGQGARRGGPWVFEPNPKHGPVQRGNVSPAPTNGQAALGNSVQIKDTSTRRVGVDPSTGQIVVLDEHLDGRFHGHVREWDELTTEMQNTLKRNGLVDRKGRPIRR
jgi:hypothetical protein